MASTPRRACRPPCFPRTTTAYTIPQPPKPNQQLMRCCKYVTSEPGATSRSGRVAPPGARASGRVSGRAPHARESGAAGPAAERGEAMARAPRPGGGNSALRSPGREAGRAARPRYREEGGKCGAGPIARGPRARVPASAAAARRRTHFTCAEAANTIASQLRNGASKHTTLPVTGLRVSGSRLTGPPRTPGRRRNRYRAEGGMPRDR